MIIEGGGMCAAQTQIYNCHYKCLIDSVFNVFVSRKIDLLMVSIYVIGPEDSYKNHSKSLPE